MKHAKTIPQNMKKKNHVSEKKNCVLQKIQVIFLKDQGLDVKYQVILEHIGNHT